LWIWRLLSVGRRQISQKYTLRTMRAVCREAQRHCVAGELSQPCRCVVWFYPRQQCRMSLTRDWQCRSSWRGLGDTAQGLWLLEACLMPVRSAYHRVAEQVDCWHVGTGPGARSWRNLVEYCFWGLSSLLHVLEAMKPGTGMTEDMSAPDAPSLAVLKVIGETL
jgi:hypothetical protein